MSIDVLTIKPNNSIVVSTLGRQVTVVVAGGDASVSITDQDNNSIASLDAVATYTLPKNSGNYTISYGAGTYDAIVIIVSS